MTRQYKVGTNPQTGLRGAEPVEGESIEQKVHRMVHKKEPIKDNAPLLFTEKKDGVQPGYNIRTDRFEIALEAKEKIEAGYAAKRDAAEKKLEAEKEGKVIDLNGKPEPTQSTDNK